MTDTASRHQDPFVHPALFYRTPEEYAAGVGGFVRAAVEAGEPVFVAVPGGQGELLRTWLGDAAEEVAFADMTRLGRNPGRILAALQGFADQHAGRAARIVGEPIWAGRTRSEILEATKHEALINAAFAGRRATILCPYDTARLDPVVVADARRTHPTLIEEGKESASHAYADPAVVCADCDEPLPEPPDAPPFDFGTGRLREVREHAEGWLRGTALSAARQGDLVLAVAEAAANSVAHGGGAGTLRLWTAESGDVTAEIRDGGKLANPLAGRRKPALVSAEGGRGLWMMHQLCDLVEIRSSEDGLTLRLHMAP